MKKRFYILVTILVLWIGAVSAQCSICTKTAMQQGTKPAQGLNSGIIYLMLTPFAVAGYVGFKWWQSEKHNHP